jgi:GNAT superfamily N-acetyltransferase
VRLALDPPLGYSIECLDTAVHNREDFSCGVEALDTFLRTQASQGQSKHISATHVLLLAENAQREVTTRQVVGYVSLVNAVLPLAEAPPTAKKLTRQQTLPAILLARMAVDHRHQRKQLGEFLLKYALKCCWDISKVSGCFAVLVDAKNEEVKSFYLRYGFEALPDRTLRLYLPMRTIDKLFGRIEQE